MNINNADTFRNDIIIVRYDELALKSAHVRNRYENILVRNIKAMLDSKSIEYSKIIREWGRIFVHSVYPEAAVSAANVFGVSSTSHAVSCDASLDAAASLAAEIGDRIIKGNESFAIRPRRAGVHDFTSRDVGIVCGDAVFERTKERNPRVNLDNPDHAIFVEVRQKKAYVFTDVIKGVGGLPYGTQGKMVALISGGIDSPVAAWLMMKRGCELIPLYMNNDPFSDETTRQRAMDCINVLQRWVPQHKFRIYEAPHGDNLLAFLENCERKLTCVLCRRMMYRTAIAIARKEGAHGVITGSSLGQVASQTSSNMLAEMAGMDFPIYHPLIGLDKIEITDIARRIGTFEQSTKPATCCMAVPEYPSTSAKYEEVVKEEEKIDVEALVKAIIDKII